MTSQLMRPGSTSGSGRLTTASEPGSSAWPSSSSGRPAARYAVGGQSVSGARNDWACGRHTTSGELSSTAARMPPAASHASERSPLSGPTRWRPLAVSIATSRSLPTFTADWHRLFSALIRQHLFVALYRALAESLASENAARLASMQAAERNIEEHLAGLTARYHQERQESITAELLDIVAGFETLEGEKAARGRQAD